MNHGENKKRFWPLEGVWVLEKIPEKEIYTQTTERIFMGLNPYYLWELDKRKLEAISNYIKRTPEPVLTQMHKLIDEGFPLRPLQERLKFPFARKSMTFW